MYINKGDASRSQTLKMARLSGYLCVLVLSLILEVSWGGSSDLRCYTCDSTSNNECVRPLEKDNKLPVVECKSLLLDTKTKAAQSNGHPQITDIVSKKTLGKRDVINENFDFHCTKATVKLGSVEVLQRGCIATPKNLKDVCKFIKTGLEHSVDVGDCNTCDVELCNSSSNIVVSCTLVLLGIIGLFFF